MVLKFLGGIIRGKMSKKTLAGSGSKKRKKEKEERGRVEEQRNTTLKP